MRHATPEVETVENGEHTHRPFVRNCDEMTVDLQVMDGPFLVIEVPRRHRDDGFIFRRIPQLNLIERQRQAEPQPLAEGFFANPRA
ncbi:MAG TPA: hypothetical protein VF432_09955 [Thermoanaerobaculia bacterium]